MSAFLKASRLMGSVAPARFFSSKINDVVIVSAARTPMGSFQSQLAPMSATQLGAVAIEAAVQRAGISKEDVQEVYMGNVVSAGLGQAPGKKNIPHIEWGLNCFCNTTEFLINQYMG